MHGRLRAFGFSLLLTVTAAFADHGWSEYDTTKPLQLSGVIEEAGFADPHVTVVLKTADKHWTVVLAPPSRMERRGISKEMLEVGDQISVEGYQSRAKADELRADRITFGDQTIELR